MPGVSLGAELVRIGLGRSELAPERGDHRFKDATWSDNLYFRRLLQSYLAWCRSVDVVVDSLEEDDWRRAAKARFLLGILTSAAAPTNFLASNPAAVKRLLETGGTSVVRGTRNWATDLVTNGGMPSMVKRGSLRVGEQLAVTPGGVVSRDEVAELIQYAPTTEEVYERPVLVVPPPIGRYYFLDLAPGRSFVEYATSRGLQTFMLSWRNPSSGQSDWDLDTYAARIDAAIREVRDLTNADDVNVISFCAGGIMTAGVLSHLAANGESPVHSVAFAVTLLDFGLTAPIGAFSSARLLALARWNSRRAGVITARQHGLGVQLDAARRPRVELLGQQLPDGPRPAGVRHPVLERGRHERAGGTARAVPRHLRAQPARDAGRDDLPRQPDRPGQHHGARLRGRSRQRPSDAVARDLPDGAASRWGDHVRAQQRRAHRQPRQPARQPSGDLLRRVAADAGQSADQWLDAAEKRSGSWWEQWADWNVARSGRLVAAPRTLGDAAHPVLVPAPGSYVRDEVPA